MSKNFFSILVHGNSIVRSKTGSTVELTKVRPFINKLPTISKTAAAPSNSKSVSTAAQNPQPASSNQNHSDSATSVNDEGQVIVLSIANSNGNEPAFSLAKMSGKTIHCSNENNKLAGNYRVINTNTHVGHITNGLSPSASTKLTTRFRVVNNGNNPSPAIIKLHSSA